MSIAEIWDRCRNALTIAGNEVVGECRRQNKAEWFDDDCRTATNIKNDAYKKLQHRRTRANVERYRDLRRDEKRIHRMKKRIFENQRMEELEQLRDQNETRKFYHSVNAQRKTFQPRVTMCKDENGNILSEKSAVLKRWREYFDQMLNQNQEPDNAEEEVETNAEVQDPPTLLEVKKVIIKLKNNKSPGADGIPAEFYKCGGEELAIYLQRLVGEV
ncbi:uncharacterized protein [Temnothorax longispinosus]|uniref:uncharacterized protein n=1 Tax=Temnothorax longispinosus TaxID=300112 RepID=UPI003A995A41